MAPDFQYDYTNWRYLLGLPPDFMVTEEDLERWDHDQEEDKKPTNKKKNINKKKGKKKKKKKRRNNKNRT